MDLLPEIAHAPRFQPHPDALLERAPGLKCAFAREHTNRTSVEFDESCVCNGSLPTAASQPLSHAAVTSRYWPPKAGSVAAPSRLPRARSWLHSWPQNDSLSWEDTHSGPRMKQCSIASMSSGSEALQSDLAHRCGCQTLKRLPWDGSGRISQQPRQAKHPVFNRKTESGSVSGVASTCVYYRAEVDGHLSSRSPVAWLRSLRGHRNQSSTFEKPSCKPTL